MSVLSTADISPRKVKPLAFWKSVHAIPRAVAFSASDSQVKPRAAMYALNSSDIPNTVSEALAILPTLFSTIPSARAISGARSLAIASVRDVPYKASAISPVVSATTAACISAAFLGLKSLTLLARDTGCTDERITRLSSIRRLVTSSAVAS